MTAPCTLPSPAYTQTTDVKAIGPAWKPGDIGASAPPLATLALFLRPCFSMAGCVGQPSRLAGLPVSGFPPPRIPSPAPWKERRRNSRFTQESRHDR